MSMKMFSVDNGIIIRSIPDSNVIDHVPPAVYRLIENPEKGEVYLLKDRPKFNVPEKCYGTHNRNKKEIINAWKKNNGSTGVLLRGIKGAGKSVLAEDLGNQMIKMDIPVIMVDSEISRAALTIATKMAGTCMVYFDEFGKVYGEKERRDLLTYFSDSSFSKVLFVVTSNSKKELDKYMFDRPGRFLFRIDYTKLDPVAISEMLDDFGLSQDMVTMMNAYVSKRNVTFDMLRFLAPIAAECESTMEFNHRIGILNCPPPVYPRFSIEKVIRAGEPFYGYASLTVNERRSGSIKLLAEGESKAVYEGKIDLEDAGRYQVLSETSTTKKVQLFIDDIVLVGEMTYENTVQEKDNFRFRDPDQKKDGEGSSESDARYVRPSLFEHFMGGASRTAELNEEQKNLLEMAKFIVENHKKDKVAEETPESESA